MAIKSTRVKSLRFLTILSLTAVLLNVGMLQVAAAGSPQWAPTADGVTVSDASAVGDDQTNPLVVRSVFSSSNYYIVIWADDRSGDYDIYGQRYDQNGTEQWTANGKLLVTRASNQPKTLGDNDLALIADGSGGAIFTWADGNDNEVYALRIDEDGDAVSGWTANGTQLSSSAEPDTSYVSISPDGSGGAMVAWANGETGVTNFDVEARHTNADGTDGTTWNGGGAPRTIASTVNDEIETDIVTSSDGGAITTYREVTGGSGNILGAFITAAGGVAWSGAIADEADNEFSHDAIPQGDGAVIVSYTIDQSGNDNIKMQHMNNSGVKQLTATGAVVTSAANSQDNSKLVIDDNEIAIITWEDDRNGAETDIFAQAVEINNGTVQWTANGEAISDTADSIDQDQPELDINGANGAVITFRSDAGAQKHIYAQHINVSGTAQWTANGELVETVAESDSIPAIAADNNGGAAITWARVNGGTDDVMIQYMGDSLGANCASGGSQSFCGTQSINNFTLTFSDIPDSFVFGTITEGATQDSFNNTTPAADDLLSVFDDRGSGSCASGGCGGFIVDVQPDGTFTDGTNTIPLTNLYIATSLDSADVNNTAPPGPPPVGESAGVSYTGGIPTALRTVSAPAYININNDDLDDRTTYTGLGVSSVFGGSPLVLMDGTLASTSGRNGTMSQFISFHLRVDAVQEDGEYAVIITYTLQESSI